VWFANSVCLPGDLTRSVRRDVAERTIGGLASPRRHLSKRAGSRASKNEERVVKKIACLLFTLLLASSLAMADGPDANTIVQRMLGSDPWGLSGAEITARLRITDKSGAKSDLVYTSKSLQYDPPLSKGVVRFSAPPDLAGAAFLQIQKKDGDDERFLFLPELKRSRRIAGNLRSGAFMGTDFTFADLDRRDLRQSQAVIKTKEKVGSFSCFVVDVVPKASDSEYSHVEVWVREDNFLPLRMKMYDRAKVHLKTFDALETKRVSGAWFISKSRMSNHQAKHSTELFLEQIALKASYPEDEFSVRSLEKL
jgi:hypothetical protein